MYGIQRTKVKLAPHVRVAACGLLVLAAQGFGQSQELLDALRIQEPGIAVRALDELARCERAPKRMCAERAKLSLLAGFLLLAEGDPAKAAAQLARVKPPRRLEAFHAWYLAQAHSYANDKPMALKLLLGAKRWAIGWHAKRIDVRIAELQLDLGQATKARPTLERYAAETGSPEALLARAYARQATGAKAEATKDFRTIALRFPSHPHAPEALRALGALGVNAFTFEEQLSRIQALLWSGSAREALAQSESITAPDLVGATKLSLIKGQALLAQGKESEAFAHLDRAMSGGTSATAAEAMMAKARRYMRMQDHEKARTLMMSLGAKYPENGNADDAAYLGSWMSLADGKLEQAIQDFEAFEMRYRFSRKRDEARWYRAWALARLNRYADARSGLLALINDFPRSSLLPQAKYWSARWAQLGGLETVVASRDGGPDDRRRVDFEKEYRDVISVFPGTLYSVLADERLRELGFAPTPIFSEPPRPLNIAFPPSLALARELVQTGLYRDAAEEINRVVGTVNSADEALVMGHAFQQLSEFGPAHALAARWLWGAVYGSKKPEAVALMYPKAFAEMVESKSSKAALDPYLAWAVMRRESAFRPEVVSQADARGLMQIIPPTAKQIAQQLKLAPPAPDALYGIELNIEFGTWYLSALLERMGHPALCAAAYNAGPSAVARWTTQRGGLPLDEFIEEIPYKETRGYVKQVLADYVLYHQLYEAPGAAPRIALSLPTPKSTGVAF